MQHRSFLNSLFLAVSITFVCLCSVVQAEEYITDFRADIVIEPDGALRVTEMISVIAERNQIKHGIYRDFPTEYRDENGLLSTVGFELLSVHRGGRAESYHIENLANGLRIYIGDADSYLFPGKHTYRLEYRTTRQLGSYEDFDELYWNVTGNGWEFIIENAQANIVLPDGMSPLEIQGYTGYAGETGRDYEVSQRGNILSFKTTRPLDRYEGMTVAVSWPKGAIAAPGSGQRIGSFITDNKGVAVAFLGLLVATSYFIWSCWWGVGRDPKKGTIIPLFEAPKHMSPAAIAYVWHRGFRHGYTKTRALAVALTSLAAKGRVRIEKEKDGFKVHRVGDEWFRGLSRGERKLIKGLLGAWDREIVLSNEYNEKLGDALPDFSQAIEDEYNEAYFRTNFRHWLDGFLIAFCSGLGGLLLDWGPDALAALFLVVFGVIVFGVPPYLLANKLIGAISRGRLSPPVRFAIPLIALFAAPFVAAAVAASAFDMPIPGVFFDIFVLEAFVLFIFLYLLEAPTMRGRKVLDKIEGYRLYLSVAEQDRLAMMTAEPEMTPELYERHLPYAMALGVEE